MPTKNYQVTHDPTGVDYTFDGELLGESTSQHDDSMRWTEVKIFKTDTSKYVVHSVGCSDVYHTLDGQTQFDTRQQRDRNCSSGTIVTGGNLQDDATACTICKPHRSPAGSFREETDRSNVHITETVDGVVECLMATDREGTLYLPKTSQRALDAAAIKEPALKTRAVSI